MSVEWGNPQKIFPPQRGGMSVVWASSHLSITPLVQLPIKEVPLLILDL